MSTPNQTEYLTQKVLISFTLEQWTMLCQSFLTQTSKNNIFYKLVPQPMQFDIAEKCKSREWLQYCIDTDPEFSYINNSYKREQENFHDIGEILGDHE
jgi:hypothetical protein